MEQQTQSNEWSKSFQDSKHQDYSEGKTITNGDSFINQQQQQEMSAFQEQKTASEAYQKMQTAAHGFTVGDVGDKAQRLAFYANDAGVQERLNEVVMAMPDDERQQFMRTAADFTANKGTSDLSDNGAKLMAFAKVQPDGSDFAYVMTGTDWTPQDQVKDTQISSVDNGTLENKIPHSLNGEQAIDAARAEGQASISDEQKTQELEARADNQQNIASGSQGVHDHKLTGKVENAISLAEEKGTALLDMFGKKDEDAR